MLSIDVPIYSIIATMFNKKINRMKKCYLFTYQFDSYKINAIGKKFTL